MYVGLTAYAKKVVIYMNRLTSVILVLGVMVVMGSVNVNAVEKVDGFVCPVITTENVLHSPKGGMIGEGHYTIGGPTLNVPVHATNGSGTGTPPGPHSQPGDTDYTAIWVN